MLSWLILTLCLTVQVWATVDVTIPYNDPEVTYLPSRERWVPNNATCGHVYSNVAGAAVKYTFTGTAIKLFMPKAGNGANVKISFSDGSTWNYNTQGTFGCGSWYGLTFPAGQYKPLTVTMEPTGGGFMNLEKIVVTQLTPAELQSFSSRPTSSLASNTVVSTTTVVRTTSAVPSPSTTSVQTSTVLSSSATLSTPAVSAQDAGTANPATETVTTPSASESITMAVGTNAGASRNNAEGEGSESKDPNNKSTVAAAVLGSLLGTLLLGAVGTFLWWNRKKKLQNEKDPRESLMFGTKVPYYSMPSMHSLNGTMPPHPMPSQPVTPWMTGYGQPVAYYPVMPQQMPFTPGQLPPQMQQGSPQGQPVTNPFEQLTQAQVSPSGVSDPSRFSVSPVLSPFPPSYNGHQANDQIRALPSTTPSSSENTALPQTSLPYLSTPSTTVNTGTPPP